MPLPPRRGKPGRLRETQGDAPLSGAFRLPPPDCRRARTADPWRGPTASGLPLSTSGFSKKRLKPGKKERGCWERHASVPCGPADNSVRFHPSSFENLQSYPRAAPFVSWFGLGAARLNLHFLPLACVTGLSSVPISVFSSGKGLSPEDPWVILFC